MAQAKTFADTFGHLLELEMPLGKSYASWCDPTEGPTPQSSRRRAVGVNAFCVCVYIYYIIDIFNFFLRIISNALPSNLAQAIAQLELRG